MRVNVRRDTRMLLALLPACSQAPSAEPPLRLAVVEELPVAPPRPPPRATIVAVGDVIPHGSVIRSAGHWTWDSLFADVKDRVTAADLAIVNLETPVAPEKNGPTARMVFNAPLALPVALRDAGFDAASLANNHVWDQGRDGLLETVRHLDATGLRWAGAGPTCADAQAWRIFDVNGLKIGWVSTTRVHNAYLNRGPDEPCVFLYDTDRVLEAAKGARDAGAELVLLSIHWGVEYEGLPKSWDRQFAQKLVAGGVDAILGHHPHVLQPAEWLEAGGRRGVVAYSLGNFVTGQGWTDNLYGEHALRRDGGMLELVVERVAGVATITRAAVLPLWTEHGAEGCSGYPAKVRAILLEPMLAAAEADPAQGSCARLYRARLAAVRKALGSGLGG